MNILLIIMASLFVQCKPENGNGDSTDEEVAFPGLEEEEAPAVEEEEAPAVEEKACQLIEMLFQNVEEAPNKLKKGKKLFSPDNDLQFYLIVSDGAAGALEIQSRQSDNRIALIPKLIIDTSEGGYHLFTFTLGGKFLEPKVTIACRGEECEDIAEKLNRLQDDDFSCMKTRRYYLRLLKVESSNDALAINVEFVRAAVYKARPIQALQAIAIMYTLIQAKETAPKKWRAEMPITYDGRSTITLRVSKYKKSPIQLKLFCSGSFFNCNPPTPQRAFYKGLVDLLNVHYGTIEFEQKPIRGIRKFFRRFRRSRNLPP